MSDRKTYVVAIKPSVKLEGLTAGRGYTRKSPEELTAIRDEKQRMLEPVCQYLDGLGLKQERDYQLRTNLCTVTTSLTPEQADELRKQPFVKIMTEDFKVSAIRSEHVSHPDGV